MHGSFACINNYKYYLDNGLFCSSGSGFYHQDNIFREVCGLGMYTDELFP